MAYSCICIFCIIRLIFLYDLWRMGRLISPVVNRRYYRNVVNVRSSRRSTRIYSWIYVCTKLKYSEMQKGNKDVSMYVFNMVVVIGICILESWDNKFYSSNKYKVSTTCSRLPKTDGCTKYVVSLLPSNFLIFQRICCYKIKKK